MESKDARSVITAVVAPTVATTTTTVPSQATVPPSSSSNRTTTAKAVASTSMNGGGARNVADTTTATTSKVLSVDDLRTGEQQSVSTGVENSANGGTTTTSSNAAKSEEPPSTTIAPAAAPAKKRKSVGTAGALNKTYFQFVQEAIVDMADRTGSSLPMIKKWIIEHYPELDHTSAYFTSRINLTLKQGLTSKPPKFTKVKGSYKIAREYKVAEAQTKRRKKAAAAAQKKRVSNGGDSKKAEKNKDDDDESDEEDSEDVDAATKEARAAAKEAARVKAEAEQKAKLAKELLAKQRSERLRRRRFPMEDTKLHAEDKELGVKPPPDVQSRPYLPYFFHITYPLNDPSRSGKTGNAILAGSKVETLDQGSRGIVPDLLQVYHFFRGDIQFTLNATDSESHNNSKAATAASNNSGGIAPAFSLRQLICCVEQLQNGYTKRTKLVPPLLVHLFVTCLQILLQIPTDEEYMSNLSKNERQLRKDFAQYLLPALSAVSWADVTYLYMDAMERFYCSDASRDPSVLEPLITDVNYLFGRTDEPQTTTTIVPSTPQRTTATVEVDKAAAVAADGEGGGDIDHPLPTGYLGYLGDPRSALHRAHAKLARQDPWLLTAEDVMALLRALTEDILATHPAASNDIAQREDAMFNLLKAKRTAEFKFRKIRLAFEGPKRPNRTKVPSKSDEDGGTNAGESNEQDTDGNEINGEKESDKPFVPTATKKQFETAKKALDKANEQYEKGIRTLVARTEPIGYDRNYNAVYCFLHDPEVLYVEERKPPVAVSSSNTITIPSEMMFQRYSWHVIETTSLLDQYIGSLDIRGRREHDLYEAIVGPPGSHQSLRRFLYDDVKEQSDARNKIKEKESLRERLEVARIRCDEEKGRRSGRLAGQAEIELMQIQSEIDSLELEAKGKTTTKTILPTDRTGLEALTQFEMAGRMESRRTREKKNTAPARKLPLLYCSRLVTSGNIDGTGLVGMLVTSLLDLEEQCESIASWERTDMSRSSWISRLESAVSSWNSIISLDGYIDLGSPPEASAKTPSKRNSIDSSGSAGKRRKVDSPTTTTTSSNTATVTVSTIVTMLRQPLLDLEERVADITNVAMASRDVDLADDNMSVDDAAADQTTAERLERAWKKILHKLRQTPARKHGQIRELVVSAIGAARQAHVPHVVAQLRSALLLYHPNAAADCRRAAVDVLVLHGDYIPTVDDDDSDDEGGVGGPDNSNKNDDDTPEDTAAVSVVSAEAAMLRGSLGGTEDATREDWVGLVKATKTISRLASLTAAFMHDAIEKLEKVHMERDALTNALTAWSKAEDRRKMQRGETTTTSSHADLYSGPSEVWANVRYTDEICMAKAEKYPWWPAKVCIAKDPTIANTLVTLNRSLVALVGEMGGLRVVHSTLQIRPFTGELIPEQEENDVNDDDDNDDDTGTAAKYSKEMRTQLDECMTLARRIQRGLQRPQPLLKPSR